MSLAGHPKGHWRKGALGPEQLLLDHRVQRALSVLVSAPVAVPSLREVSRELGWTGSVNRSTFHRHLQNLAPLLAADLVWAPNLNDESTAVVEVRIPIEVRLALEAIEVCERQAGKPFTRLVEAGWTQWTIRQVASVRLLGLDPGGGAAMRGSADLYGLLLRHVVRSSFWLSDRPFLRPSVEAAYSRSLNEFALDGTGAPQVRQLDALDGAALSAPLGRHDSLPEQVRVVLSSSMFGLAAMTHVAERALAAARSGFRFVRTYRAMSCEILDEVLGGSADTWDLIAIADWSARKLLASPELSSRYTVVMSLPAQMHARLCPTEGLGEAKPTLVPRQTTAEAGFARIDRSGAPGRRRGERVLTAANTALPEAAALSLNVLLWEPFASIAETTGRFVRHGQLVPHSAFLIAPTKRLKEGDGLRAVASELARAWNQIERSPETAVSHLANDGALAQAGSVLTSALGIIQGASS